MKKKEEEILKKDWREDIQLTTKFKDDRPAILQTLEKFKSIWHGHLWRIIVANNRNDLLNGEVRPVRSAPYRAEPTTSRIAAAESD